MKTLTKISESAEQQSDAEKSIENYFAGAIQNDVPETQYKINSNAGLRPLLREELDYFGLSIIDSSGFKIYEE